jgi:cyclomaltodextrinase
MAEWVRHALWWQVYPLGFVGAYPARDTPAGPHPLRRLEAWLDYAVELGASGLALGPIFASETHGYDIVDHLRIDPRLGDDVDVDALISAARRRGLRVLLDGVFNHVGRGHPAFRAVVEQGPAAPTASWFRLTWPQPWQPGVEPQYANFEGHGALVALNHLSDDVKHYVVDVMKHWLDRGADGWRLDAAYAVPQQFWADVLPQVRAAHPDAYLVGEVLHGDYVDFVHGSTADAVTQYELWKAIWSSLNERNFFELAWALDRHNGFLDAFVPLTFVGNHDVTRIASKLSDERHLAHALVILLTVGGTPSVYAGDEQAFRGIKQDRDYGDDAVRPPFPATPAELAPFGRPTFALHQELIGLRRRHPWLHRAKTRIVHLTNEHLVYEVSDGSQRLLVALNIGDVAAGLPAPQVGELLAGVGEIREPAHPDTRLHIDPACWAVAR